MNKINNFYLKKETMKKPNFALLQTCYNNFTRDIKYWKKKNILFKIIWFKITSKLSLI